MGREGHGRCFFTFILSPMISRKNKVALSTGNIIVCILTRLLRFNLPPVFYICSQGIVPEFIGRHPGKLSEGGIKS